MNLSRKGQTMAFAVCSLILLTAQDCGPPAHVVQRFELPSCPDSGFSLPDVIDQPPYRLSAAGDDPQAETYPMCPGFEVYHLLENGQGRFYYRTRLNRRSSCSLDIGYSYLGGSPSFNRRRMTQFEPWVEVVAQLVMQDADIVPSLPATATEIFDADENTREWCERAAQ